MDFFFGESADTFSNDGLLSTIESFDVDHERLNINWRNRDKGGTWGSQLGHGADSALHLFSHQSVR